MAESKTKIMDSPTASIKFLPAELSEPHRREGQQSVRAKGNGEHQENKDLSIYQHKQSSYKFTD